MSQTFVRRATWAACLLLTALGAAGTAHAQGKNVYVSSEKDQKVYVFNTQGERVSAIDTCKRPRHMMFSRDNQQLLVLCGDSNELGIIDVASSKMTGTLPVGDSPDQFDLSPDGKTVYVSIEDENVMSAYDMASKKKLFDVKTGGEPEGVFVMPDGKTAFVTSEVANVVHVVDLQQQKTVKNVKVGQRPRRFVLADKDSLWVSNELGASVTILDPNTYAIKKTIEFKVPGMRESDITPVGMVMSADGKTMWVGLGRANHVAEVDVASASVRNLILAGKRAWGVALHPDGKTLYVVNGLSDDMTMIDTATSKATKTVPVGRVPHAVIVQP
ncbi:MAG: PQQ-dependent catabolism-associated beta-propeller protein [Pseudomonadota bacterium]|nr:PQQ-dependent catabolism-associated beta-propeller protein [Pseudomonadota bacterium]